MKITVVFKKTVETTEELANFGKLNLKDVSPENLKRLVKLYYYENSGLGNLWESKNDEMEIVSFK